MTVNKYSINNMDIYTCGDLAGYVNGEILFNYNNSEHLHEFLYRIHDPENGNNNELVSIDYGYYIPYIDEEWESIIKMIENAITEHNNKLEIDFISKNK